jgi:hypothetical protein
MSRSRQLRLKGWCIGAGSLVLCMALAARPARAWWFGDGSDGSGSSDSSQASDDADSAAQAQQQAAQMREQQEEEEREEEQQEEQEPPADNSNVGCAWGYRSLGTGVGCSDSY